MKPENEVERFVADTGLDTHAERDREILRDVLRAHDDFQQRRSQLRQPQTWRTIMRDHSRKLATAATVLLAVVLFFAVSDWMTKPAWALQDAIDALKDFRAVHIVGAFPGGTADVWIRANTSKTQSSDVVVKGSHGTITWTQDGATYHYEPNQNTVYYEHALTLGVTQWLGPELLEMLSTAQNVEVVRGKDPATGRDRVTLLCSLIDVQGAQSWIIEFDVASKLPVAFKQWGNLDRSGPPRFDALKVTYYEDLPDSVFAVHIPGQPVYVQKPLTIPDENIGVLSDTRDGLSAEGMTQQEAAERAVRTMFQAVIDGDLATLRKMCPLCKNWGDEFLRSVLLKTGKNQRIVEILKIGPISETGHSKLGPIVALPIAVQRQDGLRAEQRVIVQFRTLGGVSSCVVHGPYGLAREIK